MNTGDDSVAYHPDSLIQSVKQRVPHNGFIVQPEQATIAVGRGSSHISTSDHQIFSLLLIPGNLAFLRISSTTKQENNPPMKPTW